jgi:hypothetical protein
MSVLKKFKKRASLAAMGERSDEDGVFGGDGRHLRSGVGLTREAMPYVGL